MKTGQTKVELFIGGSNNKTEVECTVFFVADGLEKFHIPIGELKRLAREHNVPEPEFVTQQSFEDVAYYISQPEFTVNKPPYGKVLRHTALYKVTFNNQAFYGEGSAGADNVGTLPFRSYGYEIAHKRAKARCLKNVLGIPDVLIDVEVSTYSGSEDFTYDISSQEDVAIEVVQSPAEPMQLTAMFDIMSRKLGKPRGNDVLAYQEISDCLNTLEQKSLWQQFITIQSSIGNQISMDSFVSRKDFVDLFNFLTHSAAGDFLVNCGNFSSTVEAKPNLAIQVKDQEEQNNKPVEEPVSVANDLTHNSMMDDFSIGGFDEIVW